MPTTKAGDVEPLAPKTDHRDPGHGRFGPIVRPSDTAGVRVTDALALTISTYWACVNLISDDMAAIPWRAMRKVSGGGREFAEEHPVDWLLHVQPNPEMTAFTFKQLLIFWLLTHGNGLAEIERDGAGRPVRLWPLEPWRVCPERDGRGRLWYDVQNYHGPNTPLDPSDVLHIKGLGDGIWGYSVLQYAARTLGMALAEDKRAGETFTTETTPSGWIEKKKKLSDDARKRYREDWRRIHAGKKDVAILEEGDQFHQTSQTSSKDQQLLDSRQFSAVDVCKWFKVPPPKVGILDRATWSNIEHLSIAYVQTALVPIGVRTEQDANLKLFGLKQRGNHYTRFFYTALLRGDAKSRADFYHVMVGDGLMSPNEAREYEDLNPVANGDKHFVPANWNTLDRAAKGEPVSVAPKTEPPPQDPLPPSKQSEVQAKAASLRPVFLDAATRVVRREAHRLTDAYERTNGDAELMSKWQAEFLAEHGGYFVKTFSAAAEALCSAAASDGVRVVLAMEADAECKAFLMLTAERPTDELADSWAAGRAEPLADRVLHKLQVVACILASIEALKSVKIA